MLNALYIADVPDKGKGVFCKKNLRPGAVLEVSPVIVMPARDRPLLDQTLLHDYIFEWQPDGELMCCMALGWVPMYNHSYSSNCEYYMDYVDSTITIKTVREIPAGEEITINYNGDWDDEKPVWFDVAE